MTAHDTSSLCKMALVAAMPACGRTRMAAEAYISLNLKATATGEQPALRHINLGDGDDRRGNNMLEVAGARSVFIVMVSCDGCGR